MTPPHVHLAAALHSFQSGTHHMAMDALGTIVPGDPAAPVRDVNRPVQLNGLHTLASISC